MSPLLNYTTQIGAERSLGEIQKRLAQHGARQTLIRFDDKGIATTLAFELETADGPRAYLLPANIDKILIVLRREYNAGTSRLPARLISREQAARVAWRIIKDWIEAQIALVETEMVTLDQVMLPYRAVGPNKMLYEWFQENEQKLLQVSNDA